MKSTYEGGLTSQRFNSENTFEFKKRWPFGYKKIITHKKQVNRLSYQPRILLQPLCIEAHHPELDPVDNCVPRLGSVHFILRKLSQTSVCIIFLNKVFIVCYKSQVP